MNLRTQGPAPQNQISQLIVESRQKAQRYDFQGAAEMLERARKLDPSNDKLLLELGSVYARGYDFATAQRCFEEGTRISTRKIEAMNAVAHYWIDVRHYDAAKERFETILRDEQHPPAAALVKLSEIYIRTRNLDAAGSVAERALQLYPESAATLLVRAKVYRQQKELTDAERLCRQVITASATDPQGRAAAGYELAALLDQQGRYDEAMQSAMAAKDAMRLLAGNALKVGRLKQNQLKELSTVSPASFIQRWSKAGQTDLQPPRKLALLCGHARSGTTLLEYVLDSHPAIVSADETSVFHHVAYHRIGSHISANTPFVSVLDWMPARELRQIRADYFRGVESFVGEPIADRLLLDKNPANTGDIPAISRIFPETKFIVALRDPRDVCLSCFMQPVPILPDTVFWLSLEGTIVHYTHIMALWLAWREAIGSSAIEVKYEDMVADQEATSRRVLEFLGMPWDERVLRFHEHAQTKVVRSPTFAEVNKPIYKTAVARWRNYEKYFEPHLAHLERFLRSWGYA